MNTLYKLIIAVFLAAPMLVCAAVDNAPISAGTTTGRNVTGSAPEAPFQNPALLGCDRVPSGGILLAPITDYGFGYWSDKLALSPFTFLAHVPTDTTKTKAFINDVLANSINAGNNADDNSRKAADLFKNGASIYSGFRTSLMSFAYHRFAFDVTTHADEEMHIPSAPFLLLFSPTGSSNGLQRGNTLDFSNFNQQGIWATDFTLQMGLPVNIPALHDFFKLRYGAGGVGIKYVMGHSMIQASSTPGSTVTYDTANGNNVLKMDGHFTVQTAGAGFHGPWEFQNPFENGVPVNGHGLGVDIGGILYDDNAALSINVQNLGVLFWTNNVKSVTYDVKKGNLDMYSLISGISAHNKNADSAIYSLFADRSSGETFPTSRDTLSNASSAITRASMISPKQTIKSCLSLRIMPTLRLIMSNSSRRDQAGPIFRGSPSVRSLPRCIISGPCAWDSSWAVRNCGRRRSAWGSISGIFRYRRPTRQSATGGSLPPAGSRSRAGLT
jgi:hypothetical protein